MDAGSGKSFLLLDWIVLGAYFALLALSGWWFSRVKQAGTEDYFLGGRRMPVWAVAISVVATATSAATFIGAPEEAYSGNLTYLSTNIGSVLAVIIVAAFFIPAFYKARVTTVYDLLTLRFGDGSRRAASGAFLLGRVAASGARLFITAIPLSLILFRDTQPWMLLCAIAVLAVVGILYTLAGGIRSIIWTDVVQTVVFVGAAVAALVMLWMKIPLGTGEIIDVIRSSPGNKLEIVDSGLSNGGVEFGQMYTLITSVTGFMLLGIAAYGTDHDLAQRMLTCRSAVKGSASALLAIAVNLPIVAVFMVLGLLLYVFYQRPDVMAAVAPGYVPDEGRKVFLTFILREMPTGMTGLMMAGLFAVGLGSFNSALNAMSAATINDFYRPLAPGKDERHYLAAGRAGVAAWGVMLAAFAAFCVYWQRSSGDTLISFALSVMNFAYAGLLGVFLTTLFTKRGNTRSVIASLITGFVVVLLMQRNVWEWWTGLTPWSETLGTVTIAFPWHLTLGTLAATAVCCMGSPKPTAPTPVTENPRAGS